MNKRPTEIMEKNTITELALINAVLSGAIYCSNADAAHTDDYPDDRDSIIKAIQEQGFCELDPDGEDFDEFADALARLDLCGAAHARIFRADCYTFAPDVFRL